MAITEAQKLSDLGGMLSPEVSAPYFAEAKRQSVVQQLARQVPVGITGTNVPIVTSKPQASWTAEGGQKQTTQMEMGIKSMKPQKLTAIAVVSAEIVRANPAGYMQLLVSEIGEAFGRAFDAATLHGTNTPFGAENYIGATTKSVTLGTTAQNKGGLFGDINAGLKLLTAEKKKLTGFVFDNTAEPDFNAATDSNGRPLFIDNPNIETAATIRGGKLLGRQFLMGDDVGTNGVAGYAGDWTKVLWGVTSGLSYDISTESTVTINNKLVSLWEHNLVAIRAEAEYGFVCADKDAFVKFAPVGG